MAWHAEDEMQRVLCYGPMPDARYTGHCVLVVCVYVRRVRYWAFGAPSAVPPSMRLHHPFRCCCWCCCCCTRAQLVHIGAALQGEYKAHNAPMHIDNVFCRKWIETNQIKIEVHGALIGHDNSGLVERRQMAKMKRQTSYMYSPTIYYILFYRHAAEMCWNVA